MDFVLSIGVGTAPGLSAVQQESVIFHIASSSEKPRNPLFFFIFSVFGLPFSRSF
jgi:hypothetical protein